MLVYRKKIKIGGNITANFLYASFESFIIRCYNNFIVVLLKTVLHIAEVFWSHLINIFLLIFLHWKSLIYSTFFIESFLIFLSQFMLKSAFSWQFFRIMTVSGVEKIGILTDKILQIYKYILYGRVNFSLDH